ncbi:MAG: hypothetical protein JWO25_307 [Alphaproteobacteria bacterium]|nr:hypothetical protein [Alphaproteobacteria bacterium]
MPDSVAAKLAGSDSQRLVVKAGRLSKADAVSAPRPADLPAGLLDGLLFLLILLAWSLALWSWVSHYATTLG